MLPDTAMRKWKVTLFEGSTGTKACLKGGILYFYTWYLGLNTIYLVLPLSEVPNSGGAEVHLSALIIVLGQ